MSAIMETDSTLIPNNVQKPKKSPKSYSRSRVSKIKSANVDNNSSSSNSNNNIRNDDDEDKQKNQTRNKQRDSQRRIHYEDHLTQKEVSQGLEEGTLVKGYIRVNPYNRAEAYITCTGLCADVFVNGEVCRNRAFEGDLVAVKLDPEKKWRRREANVIQPTGKVVAIIEKLRKSHVVGCLRTPRDDNTIASKDQFAIFAPVDKRYPRMLVPLTECPQSFKENPAPCSDDLFVAKILKWTTTASTPMGQLVKRVGKIGDFDAEMQALLIQSEMPSQDFSESVMNEVKQYQSDAWTIPEEEVSRRNDMRGRRIFSVDPKTCRDVDDAVSIERISDQKYEVAIHIADVSYFVRESTMLDQEAKNRATSVYLVNQMIPMLPRILSEHVCSLNEGVDRLAFTVFATIDMDGLVDESSVRFEKTIIRNSAKLSYEDAESIINDQCAHELANDLKALHRITSQMRKLRLEKGFLDIINQDHKYVCDEHGRPLQIVEKMQLTSCDMIEELMLLANVLVAKQLQRSERMKELALFRNHNEPNAQKLEEFGKYCSDIAKRAVHLENVTLLNEQLHSIYKENKNLGTILFTQVRKAMQHANYVRETEQEQLYHYGLNLSCYTHFTSPIRRYADIMVHRMLFAALQGEPFAYSAEQVDQIASICNSKRLEAKKVEEQSYNIFVTSLYGSGEGRFVESAIITQISQKNITIYIPKISLETRICIDDIQCASRKTFNRKDKTLTLTTTTPEDRITLAVFDTISCEMFTKRSEQDLQYEIAAKLIL